MSSHAARDQGVGMVTDRRGFLSLFAAVGTGAASAPPVRFPLDAVAAIGPHTSWDQVRALFELRPDRIHMSGLLFASHPAPVRDAIAKHRLELQQDPAGYISHERWRLEGEVLKSAATYLRV